MSVTLSSPNSVYVEVDSLSLWECAVKYDYGLVTNEYGMSSHEERAVHGRRDTGATRSPDRVCLSPSDAEDTVSGDRCRSYSVVAGLVYQHQARVVRH